MTLSLNPKLLDVVKIPSDRASDEHITGTVVEVFGPDTILVEVSDDNGIPKRFVTLPRNKAEIVWESKPTPPTEEMGKDAQTLFEEGLLLLQNGVAPSAKSKFARSFELDPNQARGLLNSALGLVAKGAFDQAIFILGMIADLQPDYQLAKENLAITHLNRGVREAKRGALDKAVEDFTSALLIGQSPEVINLARRNLAAAHTQVALRHVDIKRFEEALHLFLLAFELEPSNDTKRNFALGLVSRSAWKSEGRSQINQEAFQQPLLMGLTFSECLNAFGATLARLGDIPRANEVLQRAAAIDPANELVRKNLRILSSAAPPDLMSLNVWTQLDPQPAVLHTTQ